jgi:hypothetical protein
MRPEWLLGGCTDQRGDLQLSRGEGPISAPEKGLPELIRDICKILHHAALALPHFSPFSFFFLPALKERRRAIDTHPHASKRRLSGSAGSRSCPAAFL